MRLWLRTSVTVLVAARMLGITAVLLAATPIRDTTITVTDEDHRTVQATVGETIILRLSSTPGTGFTWRIAAIDKERLMMLGEAIYEAPPTPVPGASGYQVFRFRPQKVGSARVTLQYVRPWEADAQPIRRFDLEITVHEDQAGS